MSLSPFIDGVVRPVYNKDIPEYSHFTYLSKPNIRLAYASIKYFRKLLFAIVAASFDKPSAILTSMVIITGLYMIYLVALRPKTRVYLILELIL